MSFPRRAAVGYMSTPRLSCDGNRNTGMASYAQELGLCVCGSLEQQFTKPLCQHWLCHIIQDKTVEKDMHSLKKQRFITCPVCAAGIAFQVLRSTFITVLIRCNSYFLCKGCGEREFKDRSFGKKFSFSTSHMLHVNTSYLHWVAVKYQWECWGSLNTLCAYVAAHQAWSATSASVPAQLDGRWFCAHPAVQAPAPS